MYRPTRRPIAYILQFQNYIFHAFALVNIKTGSICCMFRAILCSMDTDLGLYSQKNLLEGFGISGVPLNLGVFVCIGYLGFYNRDTFTGGRNQARR